MRVLSSIVTQSCILRLQLYSLAKYHQRKHIAPKQILSGKSAFNAI